MTGTLTAELDGAHDYLDVPAEELLLAAISRTIARTIGDCDLAVDVKADGEFTVVLPCMSARSADATESLRTVHQLVAAARQPVRSQMMTPADVFVSFMRTAPEPVSRDVLPAHETLPSAGHALEVRIYRAAGLVQMDWWYDTRRLDRTTVDELTEQFPLALIDLTTDAVPPIHEPVNMAMA